MEAILFEAIDYYGRSHAYRLVPTPRGFWEVYTPDGEWIATMANEERAADYAADHAVGA